MLARWFGENKPAQTDEKTNSQPVELAGSVSGLDVSKLNTALVTGQSDRNIASTFGDAVPGIPMMITNRAFTKEEAAKLKEVSSQLEVMADATKEASEHLVKINQKKIEIKKAVGAVHRSNIVATTAIHGVDTQTAIVAEKQRLNHANNNLNYQEVRQNIDARISGRLKGYGY